MTHNPFDEFDPDHLQDAQKEGTENDSTPSTEGDRGLELYTALVPNDDISHLPDPTNLLDPRVYSIDELEALLIASAQAKRNAKSHVEDLDAEYDSTLRQAADEETSEWMKDHLLAEAEDIDRERAMYAKKWQTTDDVERLVSVIKEFREESLAHGQQRTQSAERLSSRAERLRESLRSQLRTASQVKAVMGRVTDEEGVLSVGGEPTAPTTDDA